MLDVNSHEDIAVGLAAILAKARKYGSESTGAIKKYECQDCEDSGYLIKHQTTGEIRPSRSVLSSEEVDYRRMKCKCLIAKENKEMLEKCGIPIEQLEAQTFDTFRILQPAHQEMKTMASSFVLDAAATGMAMLGKSGMGKTHICTAVMNEIAKKGITVRRFEYVTDMTELKRLQRSYDDEEKNKYNRLMTKWKTTPCLYIDDLFKFAINNNGTVDAQEARIIMDIVNYRYNNRMNQKTIISSEYSSKQMREAIDEAVVGRLIEIVEKYALHREGENERLKKRKSTSENTSTLAM